MRAPIAVARKILKLGVIQCSRFLAERQHGYPGGDARCGAQVFPSLGCHNFALPFKTAVHGNGIILEVDRRVWLLLSCDGLGYSPANTFSITGSLVE
jgi:hypothetical protein